MNSNDSYHIRYVFIFILFAITSCTYPQKEKYKDRKVDSLQTLDLLSMKNLIGDSLEELKVSSKYQVTDTIFEAEDGRTWPGKVIMKNKEVLLFLETSWQDTLTIKRIIVSSPKVLIRDTIHIKSKFVDIKDFLSKNVPLGPDGYFYLKDKLDSNLYYYFESNGLIDFRNSHPRFDSIPNNLTVELIMLK